LIGDCLQVGAMARLAESPGARR